MEEIDKVGAAIDYDDRLVSPRIRAGQWEQRIKRTEAQWQMPGGNDPRDREVTMWTPTSATAYTSLLHPHPFNLLPQLYVLFTPLSPQKEGVLDGISNTSITKRIEIAWIPKDRPGRSGTVRSAHARSYCYPILAVASLLKMVQKLFHLCKDVWRKEASLQFNLSRNKGLLL